MDINEVFDDISLSEDKFTEQGYKEGVESGIKKNFSEGEALGLEKGRQIGSEIGFYIGFVSEYRKQFSEPASDKRTEKILTALNKLDTLTSEFPDYNCKEGFEEKLEEIRAKFKQLCSLLKINSEFSPSQTNW